MACINISTDFIRLREQALKEIPKEHLDVVVEMLNGQYHLGRLAIKCDYSEDDLRKTNVKLEELRNKRK